MWLGPLLDANPASTTVCIESCVFILLFRHHSYEFTTLSFQLFAHSHMKIFYYKVRVNIEKSALRFAEINTNLYMHFSFYTS